MQLFGFCCEGCNVLFVSYLYSTLYFIRMEMLKCEQNVNGFGVFRSNMSMFAGVMFPFCKSGLPNMKNG